VFVRSRTCLCNKLAQELRGTERTTTSVVPPGPINIRNARWQRFGFGVFKCIVDASFSYANIKVDNGMCIRDVEGCLC